MRHVWSSRLSRTRRQGEAPPAGRPHHPAPAVRMHARSLAWPEPLRAPLAPGPGAASTGAEIDLGAVKRQADLERQAVATAEPQLLDEVAADRG
eukprot:scaffold12265_cov116-Isochrysis_galbana.AAC.5